MKYKKYGNINNQEAVVRECVVCEIKIDDGSLCTICLNEVDEKKEIIIRKDHPFLILTEKKTH